MAAGALEGMERNTFSNETQPAAFTAGGRVYDPVKVRYRGAWARSWPKKPLKIFFEKGKEFEGNHCLNLNSGWRDPALFREVLAYQVYAACGVPASKARLVRVHLNGHFQGLYVDVEQPDKAFLERFHLKGASIYKASSRQNQADERDHGVESRYHIHYEKQTRKSEDYGELARFCGELAAATNNIAAFFQRNVDVGEYINYLAVTVLIQHWDGFNKNHFLVCDSGGSGKWIVVPWDLDRTFGDHWNWSFDEAELPTLLGTQPLRGVTGWNRLQDRFFREPTLKARFLDRLDELLKTEFTEEKLFPLVDRLAADIGPEVVADRQRWRGPAGDFGRGIAQLKEFIKHRRAFLQKEIETLRSAN
jgi:spore coat protein H